MKQEDELIVEIEIGNKMELLETESISVILLTKK